MTLYRKNQAALFPARFIPPSVLFRLYLETRNQRLRYFTRSRTIMVHDCFHSIPHPVPAPRIPFSYPHTHWRTCTLCGATVCTHQDLAHLARP